MTAEKAEAPLCSITACPSPATESQQGEVGRWRVTFFYCAEHAREMAEGVPLGPVGVDTARIKVEPVGTAEPRPGGRFPGIA